MEILKKSLFIFVCFGLFLNQAGRIAIGNNIAFTVLDISVVIFLLVGFFIQTKNTYSFKKDVFTRPFLIFIGIALLSLLLNSWRYHWQQDLVAFLYLLRFIGYCLIYTVIKKHFAKNKQFVQVSLTVTAVGLLLAGIIQYFFYSNLRNLYYLGWDDHLYRLFSTFFDPNFAGAFFVLIFTFFITLFIQAFIKNNRKLYIFYGILLIITLIEIFLTFSRSSLVMFFVSSSVYLFFLKKIKYMLFLILAIACIYFIVSPSAKIENTNYFRTASTEARFTSEGVAFSIIAKNPIIGIGFDAYRYAQLQYGYRTAQGTAISHADSSTDNSFLFVFATTGIFGLVAYLFLHKKILTTLHHEILSNGKNKYFAILLLSTLVGIYVDSLFINSLFYPSILLWLMIMLGIRDYN